MVKFEIDETWERFRNNPQCQPGVMIFMKSGQHYLIGNVNLHGGFCDDCSIKPDEVVSYLFDFRYLIKEALIVLR